MVLNTSYPVVFFFLSFFFCFGLILKQRKGADVQIQNRLNPASPPTLFPYGIESTPYQSLVEILRCYISIGQIRRLTLSALSRSEPGILLCQQPCSNNPDKSINRMQNYRLAFLHPTPTSPGLPRPLRPLSNTI